MAAKLNSAYSLENSSKEEFSSCVFKKHITSNNPFFSVKSIRTDKKSGTTKAYGTLSFCGGFENGIYAGNFNKKNSMLKRNIDAINIAGRAHVCGVYKICIKFIDNQFPIVYGDKLIRRMALKIACKKIKVSDKTDAKILDMQKEQMMDMHVSFSDNACCLCDPIDQILFLREQNCENKFIVAMVIPFFMRISAAYRNITIPGLDGKGRSHEINGVIESYMENIEQLNDEDTSKIHAMILSQSAKIDIKLYESLGNDKRFNTIYQLISRNRAHGEN